MFGIIFAALALAGNLSHGENAIERILGGGREDGNKNKLTEGVRVPFQLIGGIIILPVRINGSRPLNLALDTGMSAGIVFLFHSELGREVGLRYTQEVALAGGGDETGRRKANLAVGADIQISDFIQPKQTVIVADEPRRTSHWTFDGVIGKSIFDSHVVEIDYQASTIVLYEPAAYEPENPDLAIPLSLENGLPIIEAVIDTEKDKEIPVKMIIDLGNRNTLIFNVNPQKKISLPGRTLSTVVGRGIQGELVGMIGRLPRLKIGGLVFREAIASFVPEEANAGSKPAGFVFDGNIGYGVLERFKVVFDYPGRRIFFISREDASQPFEFNMVGISFEQRMDKTLLVRNVIAGSPAAEKSLRTGDVITAINGTGLKDREFREVEYLFREEHKDLELSLLRDEKPLSVCLTLRRLI